MTTKYDRNTLVPFGTFRDYSTLEPEMRERLEFFIDPELSDLSLEEADKREYPIHVYTRAAALCRLSYALVSPDEDGYDVSIREACFGPAEDGKLLLRVLQHSATGKVPFECAEDISKLLGAEVSSFATKIPREIIDVYQAPRSGRFYVAFTQKEES